MTGSSVKLLKDLIYIMQDVVNLKNYLLIMHIIVNVNQESRISGI